MRACEPWLSVKITNDIIQDYETQTIPTQLSLGRSTGLFAEYSVPATSVRTEIPALSGEERTREDSRRFKQYIRRCLEVDKDSTQMAMLSLARTSFWYLLEGDGKVTTFKVISHIPLFYIYTPEEMLRFFYEINKYRFSTPITNGGENSQDISSGGAMYINE